MRARSRPGTGDAQISHDNAGFLWTGLPAIMPLLVSTTAAQAQKAFPSPEQAAAALADAVKSGTNRAILNMQSLCLSAPPWCRDRLARKACSIYLAFRLRFWVSTRNLARPYELSSAGDRIFADERDSRQPSPDGLSSRLDSVSNLSLRLEDENAPPPI